MASQVLQAGAGSKGGGAEGVVEEAGVRDQGASDLVQCNEGSARTVCLRSGSSAGRRSPPRHCARRGVSGCARRVGAADSAGAAGLPRQCTERARTLYGLLCRQRTLLENRP